MEEKEKHEALENLQLIKELVFQTKNHVGSYGGGWISIIWGVFCIIGVAGQRLFIPQGALMGVWWTTLVVAAIFASILVSQRYHKKQPIGEKRRYARYFVRFWLPFLLLGYTLTFLIALSPSLSNHYISIVMLLVVSTGYLIIGLLFYRGILYMGSIGYVGTIFSAIFFLEFSDIILGSLFGVGLIITGFVINKQWKNT